MAVTASTHLSLGCKSILHWGTEEQKQKYLPDVASGKKMAAFALTESAAGSDAGGIRTTAEKVHGGYVLNGTKQFISNGGESELYTVIALTDKERGARGASALIVEKGTEGFSFGKKEKKMGTEKRDWHELISKPVYHQIKTLKDIFIPMRDGARLAADVYLPAPAANSRRWLPIRRSARNTKKWP
jgi:alkylation response protein AidB-like acyl-CoA dehydrogenase